MVDSVIDPDALAGLLAGFRAAFPTVPVRLHVETLGMVVERVSERPGALGLIGTMIDLPDGLARYTARPVAMCAVAAPSHPLARADAAASGAAVQEAVQIVLSERSRRTEGRDYAVFSPRTWRVDDLVAKLALIRHGIGWGSVPHWLAARDLAEGRLVTVAVPGLPEQDTLATQAFHDAGHRPGPATSSWLLQRLCDDAGGGTAA